MYTITQIDAIRDNVLEKVRELEPMLVLKYEDAITSWLVRTILETAQPAIEAGAYICPDCGKEIKDDLAMSHDFKRCHRTA